MTDGGNDNKPARRKEQHTPDVIDLIEILEVAANEQKCGDKCYNRMQ